MNNFKKVGLTALAGSLAAVSANAAEMSVSGATVLLTLLRMVLKLLVTLGV